MNNSKIDDDRIKRIVLETTQQCSKQTSESISDVHNRVTDLAITVSAIEQKLNNIPDKSDIAVIKSKLEDIPTQAHIMSLIKNSEEKIAKKNSLSFSQWIKIITLILGFLAATWGIKWAAPESSSLPVQASDSE